MVAFERELVNNPTDWVVVVGDVTSTMACSISAKKLGIKVAHVEGGIRSGDITMPEEVNRLVTDSISDVFFTTSDVANKNLERAGFMKEQIQFVGNTMIDTLLYHKQDLIAPSFWNSEELEVGAYFVMTLHRPSNVDDKDQLTGIFQEIDKVLAEYKVVFPVHPRTRKNMERFQIEPKNVIMVDPLSYFEFNFLVSNAKGVITDSGGITEETTVMSIPCITMRNSTERPETIDIGTNELIGTNPKNLGVALRKLVDGNWKKGSIPPLWDGLTAERIVNWFLKNESI
jgi:UDP-N-acetylglucosamine 2-epimerase (non-hydrolysing)